MTVELVQIACDISEDGKTVTVYGYAASSLCVTQCFSLPLPIHEDHLLADEWRTLAVARPDHWRLLGGLG